MARSKKPKFKIQRRLGVELPGLGKEGALKKRNFPPGQHGMRRRKLSDYAVHLIEKQKVLYHYGLKEKQLLNYVSKAKKVASGSWVESMISTLERRLDNVIFRLNFVSSIAAARQLVSHGHVKVNGKKVNVRGYSVQPGDSIELTDNGYKTEAYQRALQHPRLTEVPSCYIVETKAEEKKQGKVEALPTPAELPFTLDFGLIAEFYWKIKS